MLDKTLPPELTGRTSPKGQDPSYRIRNTEDEGPLNVDGERDGKNYRVVIKGRKGSLATSANKDNDI